jgi:gamma-glutamyltranspeptidase
MQVRAANRPDRLPPPLFDARCRACWLVAGMLALAEPMMSGLGGDTMALVWSAKDQKVFGLNGSGRAPSGASLNRIGSLPMEPDDGAATITIPGAEDGWCALLTTLIASDWPQPR